MKTGTNVRRGRTPAPLLLLAVLALAGCAHKPTLVGKWQGNTATPQGGAVASAFAFTEDGKETFTVSAGGGPISITVGGSGTYTVSGDSLTQNITSATIGGMTMALPAASAKPQTGTFTVDADHLTLNNPTTHQSLTLTRVKE